MHQVVLYSRPGCHLCEEAREVLLDVRRLVAFSFSEVDVDGDDDLADAYGLRVPVVLVDGHERFEIAVDTSALRALVSA